MQWGHSAFRTSVSAQLYGWEYHGARQNGIDFVSALRSLYCASTNYNMACSGVYEISSLACCIRLLPARQTPKACKWGPIWRLEFSFPKNNHHGTVRSIWNKRPVQLISQFSITRQSSDMKFCLLPEDSGIDTFMCSVFANLPACMVVIACQSIPMSLYHRIGGTFCISGHRHSLVRPALVPLNRMHRHLLDAHCITIT